jgi:hypothetical protein
VDRGCASTWTGARARTGRGAQGLHPTC